MACATPVTCSPRPTRTRSSTNSAVLTLASTFATPSVLRRSGASWSALRRLGKTRRRRAPAPSPWCPVGGAAAPRDHFGLVNQVAGADSPAYFYYDGRAQLRADYAGLSSIECASFLDDSTWGCFPLCDVLTTQGRGLFSCSNPSCNRMHSGALWYALCSTCWTFEPGSRRCKLCSVISPPPACKCSNWSRG